MNRTGSGLIDLCVQHLLTVMGSQDECQPGEIGLGNSTIEELAGFALQLDRQDHYFTWSLLQKMERDSLIEAVPGKRKAYRLVHSQARRRKVAKP